MDIYTVAMTPQGRTLQASREVWEAVADHLDALERQSFRPNRTLVFAIRGQLGRDSAAAVRITLSDDDARRILTTGSASS